MHKDGGKKLQVLEVAAFTHAFTVGAKLLLVPTILGGHGWLRSIGHAGLGVTSNYLGGKSYFQSMLHVLLGGDLIVSINCGVQKFFEVMITTSMTENLIPTTFHNSTWV